MTPNRVIGDLLESEEEEKTCSIDDSSFASRVQTLLESLTNLHDENEKYEEINGRFAIQADKFAFNK